MFINLIDSLLDAPPIIDREKYLIKSDIPLSNILTNFVDKNEYKAELVLFPQHLDYLEERRRNRNVGPYDYHHSSVKYRQTWDALKLPNFIISKKLLEFFIEGCNLYTISQFFNMEYSSRDEFEKHKEIFKMIVDKFNYLKEGEEGYLTYGERGKTQIRYGKFINTILEILYNKDRVFYNQRMIEVEASVDQYKSKFNTSKYKISVLNGKDILLGYDTKYQHSYSGGMLGNSCMNNKFDYLKLYTKNPDKIFMFVITNTDDKIVARNLVWKIEKYNNFLFDRVYAIDNYISKTAVNIAEGENWIIWDECGNTGVKKVQRINEDGEVNLVDNPNLEVKLSFKGVKRYPYLDTFRYQRLWKKKLTNERLSKLYYCYESTGGIRHRH